MAMPTVDSVVGDLVAERLGRSRVFERLNIDYCCGGNRTLADACRERGLDPDAVVSELKEADEKEQAPEDELSFENLAQLADHIEQTHHVYLKEALPRLSSMAAAVRDAHSERHPELRDVQQTFDALRAELEQHMFKEEQVLFPIVRQLEQATTLPTFHCGSVQNPIRVMEHEHDDAAAALARLRELTGDFSPPDDACNTYRALLDELARLEADLHRHIHKENNILFPRAAELEAKLAAASR